MSPPEPGPGSGSTSDPASDSTPEREQGPSAIPDPDREVREEIDFHLEERARELVASGMHPDEARREARRAFGDVERIRSEVGRIRRGRERDEGRRMMMEGVARDLRLALRGLSRRPGFSAVVVGTLAVGIGAVTAIFSVVNAALLRDLPFEEADRIVFLQGAFDAPEGPDVRGASVPEAQDWASMSRSFSHVVMVDGGSVTITGEGTAERVPFEQFSEGYFDLFRLTPLRGRLFTPEEMTLPDGPAVALLGEDLWVRRFGSDPTVIGSTIRLNDQPFEVVGVLAADHPGTTLEAELFLPLGNPVTGAAGNADRGSRWLGVAARLADGVTVESAQEDMDRVAARLEEAHPSAHEDRIAVVNPMRKAYLGQTRDLFLVALAATGLLLLIAGANVANLLLVRASGRGGEVLIRKALGAGAPRLASYFLAESVVLGGLGAAVGLLLGVQGAELLARLAPGALLPAFVDVRPDWRVFGVAAGLMVLVGAAAGLVPAIGAARADLASGLRRAGAGGTSRLGAQGALVVGEVALALLLLVGAGLMTRSFTAQLAVDPGFDADELYAFTLGFPGGAYPGDELRTAVHELDARLEAASGVTAATYGSDAPLRSGYSASYIYLEGAAPEDRIRFYVHRVATDWFETLGTPLRAGRALAPADLADPNVTVVGEALHARFFAPRGAVGEAIHLFAPDGDRLRIVGVANDVRWRDLTSDLIGGADDPDIYILWDSVPSRGVNFVLRTAADPAVMAATVRAVVSDFDPDLPILTPEPMSVSLAGETARARFGTFLLGAFSTLAALLALVGLYGVLAFHVDRRRREIAVRMAVGAEGSRVRGMVVFQGMRLAAAGLLIGIVAAYPASRGLEALLFGVERLDPPTYAGLTLLMAVVALLATWVPAVRATRVDPQRALKAE